MNNFAINERITQYELQKAITFSKLFSRIKLSPSARLVLRCLVDHWNAEKMFCFPAQETIVSETGVSLRSVKNAIQELRKEGLILTEIKNSLNYAFTTKFFALVNIAPEGCRICTLQGAEIAPKQIIEKRNNKKDSIFLKNKGFEKFHAKTDFQNEFADVLGELSEYEKIKYNQLQGFEKRPYLECLRREKTKKENTAAVISEIKTNEENSMPESILDMPKEQALEFVARMPVMLRCNSKIARDLIKKWNFSENEIKSCEV